MLQLFGVPVDVRTVRGTSLGAVTPALLDLDVPVGLAVAPYTGDTCLYEIALVGHVQALNEAYGALILALAQRKAQTPPRSQLVSYNTVWSAGTAGFAGTPAAVVQIGADNLTVQLSQTGPAGLNVAWAATVRRFRQ